MSSYPKHALSVTCFLLCLILVTTACDDEETITNDPPREPTILLRVVMPTDYPDDSAKYWTMVNGPDGKAIDAKPISSGDTVEFITEEKEVPTGIQFTFLSVDTSDVYQDFYHLETYQQITPGSEFILTPFEINERKYSRQGTFRIVVNDINPPRSHHLTSKYGGMSGGSTWEKYQLRVNSDLGYPDIPHLLTIEDDGKRSGS